MLDIPSPLDRLYYYTRAYRVLYTFSIDPRNTAMWVAVQNDGKKKVIEK